ncbi:MAG: hypothetical protein IPP27_07285 [Bacteroidetes bacterium]|nr:hypothetical protein [Bacteroidota bacterium]
MINKFPSRIVLAWIVLGVAIILLTLSVTFAQSVSLIRKDNGEVKFKYKSTDKKNSQSIDTTFNVDNDEEFYSVMQGISDKHDLNLSMLKNRKSENGKEQKGLSYSMHISSGDKKMSGDKRKGESADIHIEIDKSMRDLEGVMQDLEASMANLKFEMHFDDDDIDINFHGNHPNLPVPPSPPTPSESPSSHKEHVEINIDKNGKRTKIIKKYDHDDLNIPDSLDNEDHIIVFGDKGESAPELEKVIIKENGRQIFIYKRQKEK